MASSRTRDPLTKAGTPPIFRHVGQASDRLKASREYRFHPAGPAPIYLHSHIGGSPYIDMTSRSGLTIEIFQDPSCAVKDLHLRRAFYQSFAKAVTRYRMTVLAWCTGWSVLLIFAQLSSLQSSGMP